jgi:hypothetical protein
VIGEWDVVCDERIWRMLPGWLSEGWSRFGAIGSKYILWNQLGEFVRLTLRVKESNDRVQVGVKSGESASVVGANLPGNQMFRFCDTKDANDHFHQHCSLEMTRTRIILNPSYKWVLDGGSVTPRVAITSMILMRWVEVIGNIETLGYETPIRPW